MIGRAPPHTTLGDDVDPGSLFVFIPGAMASGFLISIALLVGDALRKVRGSAGNDRRVRHTGAIIADEVRGGAGASRRTEEGLRPRAFYGILGGLSYGLAAAVIPGAAWNFLNPVGYISDIGWIWAVSMVLAVGLIVLGYQVLRLAPEWTPIVAGALGLGFALRFLFGREVWLVRISVIVGSLVGAAAVTALTWRLRRQGTVVDVPPSLRPLLRATPLIRT